MLNAGSERTVTATRVGPVRSVQASRLKIGSRIEELRGSSEGGGEEDGREDESTSEQKEPERDVSAEELSPSRPPADMLKYLLSDRTAPAMSSCCGPWGLQVLSVPGAVAERLRLAPRVRGVDLNPQALETVVEDLSNHLDK